MTYKQVEVSNLDFKNAPTYQKKVTVSARPAQEGELLVTRLANGEEETKQTLKASQWVVTNPGGEEYAIDSEKFEQLYEPLAEGRFRARGKIKALPNPWEEPIQILAPWGEIQFGASDCWVAKNGDSVYLIGDSEFRSTYAMLDSIPF